MEAVEGRPGFIGKIKNEGKRIVMRVRGLDGRDHSWNLAMYSNNARDTCSGLHSRARDLLLTLFPCEKILEEVPLPGSHLFADFYINSKRLMIEVNGEQHYKPSNFFHKNNMAFYKGTYRDKKKQEWCDINNIILVALRYDEDDNEWTDRIKAAYR